MSRKISAIILAAIMALSLTACSSSSNNIVTDTDDVTGTGEGTAAVNVDELIDPDTMDPAVIDYALYFDENGFYKGINASDYVEIPELSNIQISYYDYTVTEDDIQAEIDQIKADNITDKQITDRAVVDGDTLNIDYVGSTGGVEFEGGNTGGAGTEVTIGVTSYIEGFLPQLIGHMPGENFDINVTFPETYGNVDLAGKPAVFNITINYIIEKITPEITDEFVADIYGESMGWDSVETMMAGISETLKKTKISNAIYDYLDSNTAVTDIPVAAENFWTHYLVNNLYQYSSSYGYNISDFIGLMNYDSVADYVADYKDQINNNCKQSLCFQAVAKQLGYTPQDADIKAYCKEQMGIDDYTETMEKIGRECFMNAVLPNLILMKLSDTAVLLSEEDSPAPTTAPVGTTAE